MFRRNKIKKSLQNIDKSQNDNVVSDDFDSLSSIKKWQKEKSLVNRFILKPYQDAVVCSKQRYQNTLAYTKQNYYKFLVILFSILFFTTFVIFGYITFSPYVVVPSGEYIMNISNFYISQNAIISGLTTIGYVGIGFLLVSIVIGIISFIELYKRKKLIATMNKITKILSIMAYVLFFSSFILILVLTLIPPPIYMSSDVQTVRNYMVKIAEVTTDEEKIRLITELNNFIKDSNSIITTPIAANTIEAYNEWCLSSSYLYSTNVSAYTILYNSALNSNIFSLSVIGIIIVVVFTLLAAFGLLIIPFTIYLMMVIKEVNYADISEEVKENWNFFKKMVFILSHRLEDFSLKNIKKFKDRKTFSKYKRELEEKGLRTKNNENEFSDNNQKNVMKNLLSLEEIEKNEPNKAFLSKDGKWMYHDGKHNVFVARGDEWIPFNPNQEFHKAHLDVIDEDLNLSPSEKKAKESKFKFTNKKESSIALPDQEIDDIVKSLDI